MYYRRKAVCKKTLEPNIAPGLFLGWRIDSGLRYRNVVKVLDYTEHRTRSNSSGRRLQDARAAKVCQRIIRRSAGRGFRGWWKRKTRKQRLRPLCAQHWHHRRCLHPQFLRRRKRGAPSAIAGAAVLQVKEKSVIQLVGDVPACFGMPVTTSKSADKKKRKANLTVRNKRDRKKEKKDLDRKNVFIEFACAPDSNLSQLFVKAARSHPSC